MLLSISTKQICFFKRGHVSQAADPKFYWHEKGNIKYGSYREGTKGYPTDNDVEGSAPLHQ